MLFLIEALLPYGSGSSSDVRNNFTVLNSHVACQKWIVTLLLSSMYVLPAQANNAVQNESSNKPAHSEVAKKKKIAKVLDLRVLVDISGSMKKSDPDNLRRPAIRLLAGLIPQGSRAGIWNFGKQVNMSVKIGGVDDAWRELARQQSKKINSAGLFTNIEGAMRNVSFDWKKPDPRYKRNLIILTDGHVDISKDEKLNKASRKRILKELLPQFEKANVRIHTIGLSDDIDEPLLSTLSSYTDGLYKKVKSADDLQKLFLEMLEQSVKLDTIPLKDNRFNVDASINDMTLLVFNHDKAHPTTIVTPGKKTWSQKNHTEKVKWFRDDGFDLITIKKPQQGQWKIMAPVDENNRVVVATNLKLKLNELPGYLMFGDVLKINAHLEEDSKPLIDQRLLSKFKFILKRKTGESSEREYPLAKTEGDKFSYAVQLAPVFKEGNNELIIQAKSPTAQREYRHQFKVYAAPAEIKISHNNRKYEIKVTPYGNLLRPDSVKIDVELKDKSKHELIKKGDDWVLNVDEKFHNTRFTININALRADSKPISINFNKMLSVHGEAEGLKLTDKKLGQKISLSKKDVVKADNGNEKNKKSENEVQEGEDKLPNRIKTRKKETDMSWPMIIGFVAVGNVLLILILGGGYLMLKRRKAKMSKDITDQIGDIDTGETDVSETEELKSKGQE